MFQTKIHAVKALREAGIPDLKTATEMVEAIMELGVRYAATNTTLDTVEREPAPHRTIEQRLADIRETADRATARADAAEDRARLLLNAVKVLAAEL